MLPVGGPSGAFGVGDWGVGQLCPVALGEQSVADDAKPVGVSVFNVWCVIESDDHVGPKSSTRMVAGAVAAA